MNRDDVKLGGPGGNPKHAEGRKKTPLRFVPPVALAYLGAVMEKGANKYGPFNFSNDGASASIYYEAAMRHLLAWFAGEDLDPYDGLPHTAHVMACMAIILDAEGQGVMLDDRPKTTAFPAELAR